MFANNDVFLFCQLNTNTRYYPNHIQDVGVKPSNARPFPLKIRTLLKIYETKKKKTTGHTKLH